MRILIASSQLLRGVPADRVAVVPSIDAALARARELDFALEAVVIDSALDIERFRAAYPNVAVVPLDDAADPRSLELALVHARLAALERMLGSMLGHDVRTPLHAITLGCDLLDARAPDAKPAIDRVRRAARRASSIVDDLLDAAQLQLGGELGIALETVELVGLVERVVAEQRVIQPKRELSFGRPAAAIEVRADPVRLERALQHAIGLIMQHSVSSSHISVEVVPARGRVEVLARCGGALGEPRANGTAAIGLAVSDVVMRAHGGSLSVERSDRSTVRLVLPLA